MITFCYVVVDSHGGDELPRQNDTGTLVSMAPEPGDGGWRSRREGPYHIAFTFNVIVCMSYCVLVLDTRR